MALQTYTYGRPIADCDVETWIARGMGRSYGLGHLQLSVERRRQSGLVVTTQTQGGGCRT